MVEGRLPDGLRDRVERSMTPVRPLGSPWRRAATLLPWAAILLLAVPIVWGLRGDREALGLWRFWGGSLLQIVLALVVAGAAVAESMPGRLPSRVTTASIAGIGAVAFLATTLVTYAASATFVPAAFGSRTSGSACRIRSCSGCRRSASSACSSSAGSRHGRRLRGRWPGSGRAWSATRAGGSTVTSPIRVTFWRLTRWPSRR